MIEIEEFKFGGAWFVNKTTSMNWLGEVQCMLEQLYAQMLGWA